jgi:hypothetical protein
MRGRLACQAPLVSARMLSGVAILAIALTLVVAQLVVPGIGERQIEDRLTENGGSADVSLAATPAVRLLLGDGDRLEVRGSDLELDLTEDVQVFDRLDGFDEVEVGLADFRAGPFDVRSFELTRRGGEPYALTSTSSTTAADLVDYGAGALGLVGGPLLRFLTGQAPLGSRPIPIRLDMGMESEDGRIRVVSGGGTVGGYPAGPLAQLITAAIVVRL